MCVSLQWKKEELKEMVGKITGLALGLKEAKRWGREVRPI